LEAAEEKKSSYVKIEDKKCTLECFNGGECTNQIADCSDAESEEVEVCNCNPTGPAADTCFYGRQCGLMVMCESAPLSCNRVTTALGRKETPDSAICNADAEWPRGVCSDADLVEANAVKKAAFEVSQSRTVDDDGGDDGDGGNKNQSSLVIVVVLLALLLVAAVLVAVFKGRATPNEPKADLVLNHAFDLDEQQQAPPLYLEHGGAQSTYTTGAYMTPTTLRARRGVDNALYESGDLQYNSQPVQHDATYVEPQPMYAGGDDLYELAHQTAATAEYGEVGPAEQPQVRGCCRVCRISS
jgi:hypothetical protein